MKDTFCSHCGTKFPDSLGYPRTCASCGVEIWANPIPVCVALVPIATPGGTGLLVVRRAIPPGLGKLALVGGFLEEHESWQVGCAREVREETGVEIDPDQLAPLWFVSTEPKPNRVLLFAVAPELPAATLAAFTPNAEVSERGVVLGPDGLDEVCAFTLHTDAMRRYFSTRGVVRSHAFCRV